MLSQAGHLCTKVSMLLKSPGADKVERRRLSGSAQGVGPMAAQLDELADLQKASIAMEARLPPARRRR